MKAVLIQYNNPVPSLVTDMAIPESTSETNELMHVRAVAIKNLDKMIASGKHYSVKIAAGDKRLVGTDGVGVLANGKRVYGFGVSGILAEQALISKQSIVEIPNNLSDELAAALPNALMGSVIAMKLRGDFQQGQTILINGATGITGKIAVQMAKFYGASTIIVTGRNQRKLEELRALGADYVLNVSLSDEEFVTQLKELESQHPIDIVIDYLWGRSAQLIMQSLKGSGLYTHTTKFVNVGAMSGDDIQLSSSLLRGTDIQLLGSGLGSWTKEEMTHFYTDLLPEAFELAGKGLLKIDTVVYPIDEVEEMWLNASQQDARLIFKI